MMTRRQSLALLLASLLRGQTAPQAPVEFVCPMDLDVRSDKPGKCPRCGMELRANLPPYSEYRLRLSTEPQAIHPGQPFKLRFKIVNPDGRTPATTFIRVHERLLHLFIVGQGTEFFAHEHPDLLADGSLEWRGLLPKPGLYRLLADFFPAGGSPQLAVETLIVPGRAQAGHPPAPDLSDKRTENTEVSLLTEPMPPLEGKEARLLFRLHPDSALEPYLGAWAHLLAASWDLVDLLHEHPWNLQSLPRLDFKLIFPRHGLYKIWAQFQRQGIVNTAAFMVPVAEL
jgi:hypothetical protein